MKLVVYEARSAEKVEPTVRVRLTEGLDGRLSLWVVNEAGEPDGAGWLLSILSNGKLYRAHGIAKSLGFPLDDRGRLQLEGDGA